MVLNNACECSERDDDERRKRVAKQREKVESERISH
jgi:hypothetical protein